MAVPEQSSESDSRGNAVGETPSELAQNNWSFVSGQSTSAFVVDTRTSASADAAVDEAVLAGVLRGGGCAAAFAAPRA